LCDEVHRLDLKQDRIAHPPLRPQLRLEVTIVTRGNHSLPGSNSTGEFIGNGEEVEIHVLLLWERAGMSTMPDRETSEKA
jgi:hypothetical protein